MSRTILLVEDHEANRSVIKRRLERRGYAVCEAEDGAQAIASFQAEAPDCVIMDLSMPNMSGIEAMQRIRTAPSAQSVPMIALTAHAMESVRKSCLDAGFDSFLTKPIDFDELIKCIVQLTSNQR